MPAPRARGPREGRPGGKGGRIPPWRLYQPCGHDPRLVGRRCPLSGVERTLWLASLNVRL